jgi:zinc transport system substrate-binding protein
MILTLVSGLAVLAASLSGCGSPEPADDRLRVVAAFYPLAFAAEQVGDDRITVTPLTPPGVEPHDLELTPGDLETIAEADVVLYLGGGFQPAVEEAVEAEATGIAHDALSGLETLPGDEGTDPHVWLDPNRFASMAEAIAGVLREAGATGDARDLVARSEDLDAEFREGLADCDSRVLVTNHAAFAYLADAYDLRQEAISGISPESEPDPARLAELAAEAEAAGVTTVFTEELASPEVAETLAAEAGLDTAVLNPLENLSDEQVAAGEDYFSVMRANLDALRLGLRCA